MKVAISLVLAGSAFVSIGPVAAQGIPMTVSPVFNGAIVNGPASMVWEQGKASGSGRICGQTYSDDNEKAALLARQARGECGGRSALTADSATTRSILSRSDRPAVASTKSLTYPVSAQVRRQNIANFVERTRAVDPAGAKQLADMLQSTDIIGVIGKAIAPAGLRTDNVADAFAVYWTSAWNASIGSTETPSRGMMDGVKSQSASILLANPKITNATNAEKQEVAEALLIQAALIDSSMEQAANDMRLKRQIAVAVVKGAKAVGLDLNTMTLTDEGFIPAKRGSAVDDAIPPQPGEGQVEQALASNNSSDSTPNYALIAAAGGAGLGGMFLLGKAMGRKN